MIKSQSHLPNFRITFSQKKMNFHIVITRTLHPNTRNTKTWAKSHNLWMNKTINASSHRLNWRDILHETSKRLSNAKSKRIDTLNMVESPLVLCWLLSRFKIQTCSGNLFSNKNLPRFCVYMHRHFKSLRRTILCQYNKVGWCIDLIIVSSHDIVSSHS